MKTMGIGLMCMASLVWAQAPVEERAMRTPPELHYQQRAEYARNEREKAAANLEQARLELEEAKRAQYEAEKHLHLAKQRTIKAQQQLDRVSATLQNAQETEKRVRQGGQ